MNSIKAKGASLDDDIELKDFINIFQNDEISDNVVKCINNEVLY